MAAERRRDTVGTVLEAVGVLTVSTGIAGLALWAGLVTLGIGALVFGLALERSQANGETPPNPATPPKPPAWLDAHR